MRLSYTIILFTFHKFNNFSILYVTQDQIAKPTHYSGKKIHPQRIELLPKLTVLLTLATQKPLTHAST